MNFSDFSIWCFWAYLKMKAWFRNIKAWFRNMKDWFRNMKAWFRNMKDCCRWALRCIKLRLSGVRVVRGSWIWTSYYPITLKKGSCKVFFAKTLNRIELPTVDPGWSCPQGSGLLLLTADVEKIAELASAADGLYGMTRLCYGSGWFSPSSSQNRNFAIVAKKPKWNRVTNCRWTLRYDKIML